MNYTSLLIKRAHEAHAVLNMKLDACRFKSRELYRLLHDMVIGVEGYCSVPCCSCKNPVGNTEITSQGFKSDLEAAYRRCADFAKAEHLRLGKDNYTGAIEALMNCHTQFSKWANEAKPNSFWPSMKDFTEALEGLEKRGQ